MMSVHRAVSVDPNRARNARTGERFSMATSLAVWTVLIGLTWAGIAGLVSLF